MKFVADGMLGKLTRWLRMLGHDVRYSTSWDDAELLIIADREKRTILTRDFELYQQAITKGLEAFYSRGQTEEERLADLAGRFSLKLEIDMETSRCPKCNVRVLSVARDDVKNKVEKNTLNHYNEFWRCTKCASVYWQGGHWPRIRKRLEAAQKMLENSRKKNCRGI